MVYLIDALGEEEGVDWQRQRGDGQHRERGHEGVRRGSGGGHGVPYRCARRRRGS
jgi:hypothetical protein